MQAKALLFDLRVFAEIDIDYLPITQYLQGNITGTFPSRDILNQLSEMSQKVSKEAYSKWLDKVSNQLDEIETAQISKFPLHMGVKNGLESLNQTSLSIYVLTEMGSKAGMQFLSQHYIDRFVDEIVSRNSSEGIGSLNKRIEISLNKLKILPEECIYFCNRLSDLKVAKSVGLQTIILPSRKEKMNNLISEGSDGLIISLEEIPSLLTIEKFKGTPEVQLAESNESTNESAEEVRPEDSQSGLPKKAIDL